MQARTCPSTSSLFNVVATTILMVSDCSAGDRSVARTDRDRRIPSPAFRQIVGPTFQPARGTDLSAKPPYERGIGVFPRDE
jgi:hypothetical protein